VDEKPEVRIIVRRGQRLDLKVELSWYEPATRKETRTGMFVMPRDVDREVYKLKESFERGGCRVTVKEM
jgi:hypothetical protein